MVTVRGHDRWAENPDREQNVVGFIANHIVNYRHATFIMLFFKLECNTFYALLTTRLQMWYLFIYVCLFHFIYLFYFIICVWGGSAQFLGSKETQF